MVGKIGTKDVWTGNAQNPAEPVEVSIHRRASQAGNPCIVRFRGWAPTDKWFVQHREQHQAGFWIYTQYGPFGDLDDLWQNYISRDEQDEIQRVKWVYQGEKI